MYQENDINAVLKKISKYCVLRERSQKEVEEKLSSWMIEGTMTDEIISRLFSENFINEERYAKTLVLDKFRNNKWGKNKLREILEYQNINQSLIEKALDEIPESEYLSTLRSLIKNSNAGTVFMNLLAKGYEEELLLGLLEEAKFTEK